MVRAAQERGLALPEAADARAVTGRGIQAKVEGKPVWLGNLNLFEESGLALPQSILAQVASLEAQGKTTMIVSHDQIPVGIIAVADVVRPDAKEVIAKLHALGLEKTVMLTGDNDRVAGYIAGQVGVSQFYADLLPEDKVTLIRGLVEQHRIVAMGDG
jgi:P-type E1-E2 ATPase